MDHLAQLIYDIKTRELEVTSKIQDEMGLRTLRSGALNSKYHGVKGLQYDSEEPSQSLKDLYVETYHRASGNKKSAD